jgi:hypothetical protein
MVSGIWLPSTRVVQPQDFAPVNTTVWPGQSQVVIPSLKGAVLGPGGALTLANANQPFSALTSSGVSLGYRPNSSTAVGECYTWNTGSFPACAGSGADASMIFVGYGTSLAAYSAGIDFGGALWGLTLKMTSTSVVASYVDSPTTAQYNATISGLTLTSGTIYTIGLTKRGNIVKAFFGSKVASASGGNGGIRSSAGAGFGYGYTANSLYAHMVLGAISSVPLSDAAMQSLLQNPWQLFEDEQTYIQLSSALYPTLTAAGFQSGSLTSTSFTPEVSFTR